MKVPKKDENTNIPRWIRAFVGDGENIPLDLAWTAISLIHVTRIDRKDLRLYVHT